MSTLNRAFTKLFGQELPGSGSVEGLQRDRRGDAAPAAGGGADGAGPWGQIHLPAAVVAAAVATQQLNQWAARHARETATLVAAARETNATAPEARPLPCEIASAMSVEAAAASLLPPVEAALAGVGGEGAPRTEAPGQRQHPFAEEEPTADAAIQRFDAVWAIPGPHFDAPRPPSADRQPARPFRAQWEVDAFQWPVVVNRLFDDLRTGFEDIGQCLVEAMRRGRARIAITAARPGQGATTLALCLARAMAARGLNVGLVDANLDEPHLAERLHLELTSGWAEVMTGDLRPDEVAVRSLADQVTLLPLLPAEVAIDRAMAARTAAALERFAAAHDLCLIDLGPLTVDAAAAAAPARQRQVQAAVLVRDRRRTGDADLETAIRHLEAAGIEPLGVAENFASGMAGTRDAA